MPVKITVHWNYLIIVDDLSMKSMLHHHLPDTELFAFIKCGKSWYTMVAYSAVADISSDFYRALKSNQIWRADSVNWCSRWIWSSCTNEMDTYHFQHSNNVALAWARGDDINKFARTITADNMFSDYWIKSIKEYSKANESQPSTTFRAHSNHCGMRDATSAKE